MKHRSTIRRAKDVMDEYRRILRQLGPLSQAVSRSYVYGIIQERTSLSVRTVSQIINHYEDYKDEDFMS